ncbi:MAG: hypothetical protein QOG01_384 [Pseudonocardiales bacterium]|nr:hypothetical protein [Pseudonocardiales bacterium]
MTTPPGTSPPISPDGRHWWDGAEWVPLAPPPPAPQPYAAPPYAGQSYAAPQYGAPAGYPPPPGPYGYGYVGSAPAAKTSAAAIASLVLSILWIFGLGSLLGLVLGLVARVRIRGSGGSLGGGGVATAGAAVGAAGLALTVGLTALALPTVHRQQGVASDAALRSTLRNAAVAEESYLTENGTYTNDVAALRNEGLSFDGGIVAVLVATDKRYCIAATSTRGRTLYYDSDGFAITAFSCA